MSGEGTASQGSSRKQKRGPASIKNFMKGVAKQPGGKYTLEVDPLTNTISGKWKQKLSTYTSLLVKSKISILTAWKDVDKQTKAMMWRDVLMHFVFPGDEEKMMKIWLTQASTSFRGWKSTLNTDYVDKGISPCLEYPSITEEDWEAYVRLVKTPEYEAKRKKFKETSSKNLYPHRVSRGGYDYVRQHIRQKWEEQQQASGPDGGAHDDVPLDLSRPTVWTVARTDKKTGLITHDPTLQVVEKIGTLVEEANQGIFTPDNPRNNILTVALGMPEHRGRVRTAGHGVGHKDFFGGCYRPRKETRAHLSSEELEEVANRLRNEVREELMRTERDQREELRAEITAEVQDQIRNQFTSELAEMKRLFNQHQQQQQSVPQIEKASKQRAIDPRPAREDVIVVDWVALGREIHAGRDANWRLPVPTMDDASIYIDRNDLDYLLCMDIPDLLDHRKWLSDGNMSFWLGYLKRLVIQRDCEDNYGFIDAWYFAVLLDGWRKPSKVNTRIYNQLVNNDRNPQCVIGFYCSGSHWSLYILLPFKCTIYWICSLHKDVVPPEFKFPVEKAMQAYYVMIGNRKKNVEWIFPKGPKQKGNWECEYFCMITAKNIIDRLHLDDFEEVYDSKEPYTMEDLDKVRQEWFKEFVEQTTIHKDFTMLPNEVV